MSLDETLPPMPGQRLARGVARALRQFDFVAVEELVPAPGLRVDLMALGPKGEIWVIECKSSRADFLAFLAPDIVDRIVTGTDFPQGMAVMQPVDFVESIPGLTHEERVMILCENPARLMKI